MKPCDLCGLDVGAKPFTLKTAERTLEFCCEGCQGIYQLLHDITTNPAEPPQNDNNDPERRTS